MSHRLGEDERWPPRGGRGHHRPHQDGAVAAEPAPAAQPALQEAQPAVRLRAQSLLRERAADGLVGGGRAAPRGRELVRHRWHQRARGAGRGSGRERHERGPGAAGPRARAVGAQRAVPAGARGPLREVPGGPGRGEPGRPVLHRERGPGAVRPPAGGGGRDGRAAASGAGDVRPGGHGGEGRRGPGAQGGRGRGGLPVHRPGRAARGHGPGAVRDPAHLPRRDAEVRRAAPARAQRVAAGGALRRQGRAPGAGERDPAGALRAGVRAGAGVDGVGRQAGGRHGPQPGRVRGGL